MAYLNKLMPSNNMLFPQSEIERGRERGIEGEAEGIYRLRIGEWVANGKESTVKNEISRYPKLSTSKGHFSIPSAST